MEVALEDILVGFSVELSPLYYRVVKTTARKVYAVRLRVRRVPLKTSVHYYNQVLPCEKAFREEDPPACMTRKGDHLLWKGTRFVLFTEEMRENIAASWEHLPWGTMSTYSVVMCGQRPAAHGGKNEAASAATSTSVLSAPAQEWSTAEQPSTV